jgi:PAS domain S-box-containing protein
LEKELNNTFSAIDSMAFYVSTHPDFSEKEFLSMAGALYSTSGNLRNIAVAPEFIIKHVYPEEGNEKIVGINYRNLPAQWKDVKLAIDENKTVVAGPIKLIQGGIGIIVRSPVIIDKTVWGIVSAVVDFEKIINMVNSILPAGTFVEIYKQSNISDKLDLIYKSGDSEEVILPLRDKLNVANSNWELKLYYSDLSYSFISDYLYIHFAFGLMVAVTLISFLYSNNKTMLLKKSEKRFKDFAKCSSDWVWEVDNYGVYTYVSESVYGVLGYSQQEVLGATPFDFMSKEEAERVKGIFLHILEEQRNIEDLENWHLTKNGQEVCVVTNAVPLIDDKGVLVGYRGVDKDITQRKIWEDTVEKSKKQLEIIFNTTREGIAIMDLETNFIHCNKAYTLMTGYELNELVEKSCVDLTLERDKEKSIKVIETVKDKGFVEFFEKTCLRKDGSEIDVQMSFSLMPDKSSILVSAKDVTSLKTAQKLIDENNILLDLFFTQSLDGFFFMMLPEAIDWDNSENKDELLNYIFANQKITKINKAMLQQYRAKEKDFIGLTPNDFFSHDIEQGKKVWSEFFDKGRLHVDTSEKRFDGSDVYIQGDYICIYDENGFIKGHFGVQRDVTEARYNEEQLKKYIKIVDEDVIISQTDLNGIITYASEAFCAISGYSKTELIGRNHNIVRHPETPAKIFRDMWDKITAGNKWKGEIKNSSFAS